MASISESFTNLAMTRAQRLELIKKQDWDLIVIGGGIIGAGILKMASQQKLKVLLIEQKDFAWGSSSRSSKMVHGGLRYLAQGQLKLTLESVRERQLLLQQIPMLVRQHSFAMSHYQGQFPWPWLFNSLLATYDFFAGKKQHQGLNKNKYLALVPYAREQKLLGGSQFCDALTDDARLVQRLIQEALLLNGQAINYVKAIKILEQQGKVSGVRVQTQDADEAFNLNAKMVVNATGAWAKSLFNSAKLNDANLEATKLNNTKTSKLKMRPLRGSHIVLPSWRLPVASTISVLHPKDKRPVQIYPWQNVTIVGTTDVEHKENINIEPTISASEYQYLMQCIWYQFPYNHITDNDVISTFSGIRPVIASGGIIAPSSEKRDHSIIQERGLIIVTGGKLTTFRLIAEQVLKRVEKEFEQCFSFEQPIITPLSEQEAIDSTYSQLARYKVKQIVGNYGALSDNFLTQMPNNLLDSIGYSRHLWAELIWALKYEQVLHLDDLLLRRTRLGIILPNGAMDYIDKIKKLCSPYLPWDSQQWQDEINRYYDIWQSSYSVPVKAK